jgi:hypothetical protein
MGGMVSFMMRKECTVTVGSTYEYLFKFAASSVTGRGCRGEPVKWCRSVDDQYFVVSDCMMVG